MERNSSDVFKYKYSGALYWGPTKIWDPSLPSVAYKSFEIGKGELPFRPNHFRIFVNGDQSFLFTTDALDTKWTNSSNVKDITKVGVDRRYKEDPYFASLMAAFIISQKSGICTKHLRGNASVPKIVTSVLRFYVYYHMKRFLRSPDKMDKYVTKEMTNLIQENLPVKKVWTKKYHQGKETISAWLRTQPIKENIRNARHYGGGIGGVIGIEYEEVVEVLPMDESNDWKKFFQDDSDGVTQTGQLFLQKAAEANVYCILGAQAQTRWRIVGDGAKSLQTQEVFAKLVKVTVAQDDDKVLISNMRTAVKATNVVLKLAILPKLILIPSDLLFLKEKIPGYNNTLTLATKTMDFGKNEGLNFNAEKETEGTEGTEGTTSKTTTTQPSVPSAFITPSVVGKVSDVNKELGVVFAVLALAGAVGAWLW